MTSAASPREYEVQFEGYVNVTVAPDTDAITRVTGDGGNEWRSRFYGLLDEGDVLAHWAYNAVANHVTDASRLDGWADLPEGAVTMRVVEIQPWA